MINIFEAQVKDVDWNSELEGFVITLKDGRTVQVQYWTDSDGMKRGEFSYNEYFPRIDTINEYGLNLSDEEWDACEEFIATNPLFVEKELELSE